MIQTVNGKIPKGKLGVCAAHEHLFIDLSRIKNGSDTILDSEVVLTKEVEYFYKSGGRAIVELTNEGMGRDVYALKKISQKTNVHIITSTGFYKEPFIPDYAMTWDASDFADHFVKEIEKGIGETGIYPGVIGEVGTSLQEITKLERELLIGAGEAAIRTGLPLSTHTTLGTMATEQVDLLLSIAVPNKQIIIGHQDLNKNFEEICEILKAGVFIGFDTIGKENYRPDEERLQFLERLIELGFERQILLSADLTRKSHLKKYGGPGYDLVLNSFIPQMKKRGITDDIIKKLLIENPAEAFSIKE